MFEYYKLRKNFAEAVGFAFEFLPDKKGKSVMQLYIVVTHDGEYNFIKYHKYKFRTYCMCEVIIDEFKAKPLEYFLPMEVQHSVQKVKKLK